MILGGFSVASEEKPPAVLMKGIVKQFPGVLALDHVDFEVKAGEIHGLLGENGAGKTTLMSILYGVYKADAGEIYIHGRKVNIRSPKDAIKLGIGMVPQHFKLVMAHTVVENVILGLKEFGMVLRMKEAEKKIVELASTYGFKINPKAKIWQLSMGERQYVELLKALIRKANILILDEPTTVLTPQETRELFSTLKRMREEGKSIIFISHKLEEVKELCDRVTVLRKGRVVGTVDPKKVSLADLAKMMVGREVLFRIKKEPRKVVSEEPILKVKGLYALSDKGVMAVKNVSLEVYPGEILGIAGIAGSGQEELAEVITGMRKAEKGKVVIAGVDVTNTSPKKIFELGVAYIPESRIYVGTAPNLTIWENMIMRHHRYPPFVKNKIVLNLPYIFEFAKKRAKELNMMYSSIFAPARTLSGGNLQRLILARELAETPGRKTRLIVAVYPTRGLDVGATEYVRKVLIEQRNRGVGVLLISEDLEEILMLSDRIAVIHNGEIMGVVKAEEANIEEIGLMMGGALRKTVSEKKAQ
ncbi:MAG: ABC transporter ATP-binding protein [Thermoprotei archaeon]|nr:ABC transporter ATP-binding protein [Thermoprotei archaeon]